MVTCWDKNPSKRVNFYQLKTTLNNLLPEKEENPPVDLDYELQQQARGEK